MNRDLTPPYLPHLLMLTHIYYSPKRLRILNHASTSSVRVSKRIQLIKGRSAPVPWKYVHLSSVLLSDKSLDSKHLQWRHLELGSTSPAPQIMLRIYLFFNYIFIY